MDERELSLAVVGINYPNEDRRRSSRRFEAELCAPGERIELRPEPNNKHDEHAVAVFSERGVQIGYLKSERAVWIGAKIRAGEPYEVIFQGMAPTCAVVRIRFGGGPPTLPPERDRPPFPDGDTFYADPEGPEWGA